MLSIIQYILPWGSLNSLMLALLAYMVKTITQMALWCPWDFSDCLNASITVTHFILCICFDSCEHQQIASVFVTLKFVTNVSKIEANLSLCFCFDKKTKSLTHALLPFICFAIKTLQRENMTCPLSACRDRGVKPPPPSQFATHFNLIFLNYRY